MEPPHRPRDRARSQRHPRRSSLYDRFFDELRDDLVGFLVDPLGGREVSVRYGLFLGRLCRLRYLGRDLDASHGVVVEDGGGFQRVTQLFVVRVLLVVHDGSSTSSVSRERAGTGLGGAGRTSERPWGALPPSADQYRWAAEDPAKRSSGRCRNAQSSRLKINFAKTQSIANTNDVRTVIVTRTTIV
jgi:hypothetical protein